MAPKRTVSIVEFNKLKQQIDKLKLENKELAYEINGFKQIFNYEGPYSLLNLYNIAKGNSIILHI